MGFDSLIGVARSLLWWGGSLAKLPRMAADPQLTPRHFVKVSFYLGLPSSCPLHLDDCSEGSHGDAGWSWFVHPWPSSFSSWKLIDLRFAQGTA